MSSCSHSRSLELQIHQLLRRIDGLEAAVGELRVGVNQLESVMARVIHNTNNHERASRVLNEQLLDLSRMVPRVELLERAIGTDVDVGDPS